MPAPSACGVRTYAYVGAINLLIFCAVFSLAECSYRIYRDGIRDGLRKMRDAFVGVPYSNLGTGNWVIYDAELGYRLNPEKPRINDLSIRHGEVVVPKPEGLYRILVLGDSIPYDNPGFVNEMRDRLGNGSRVEVINAGVPGYTAYQEVEFFKRYLLKTEPDLVIWTYCLNDNHKLLHRFDEKAKMLWTDEAVENLEARSWFSKLASRSYILSELKLRVLSRQKTGEECRTPWECVPDFNIAWKDESWIRYEASLAEMKDLTGRIQGRLAVVVFPFEPQLDLYERMDAAYVLKPQRNVMALCRKYGLACLDLFPVFKARMRQAKLFRDGVHLTKEGHQLTAELISAFLHERQLLPAHPP